MRINKAVAKILNISRRNADDFLNKSKVFINNEEALQNSQVQEGDVLLIHGKKYIFKTETVALVPIFKKRGLICTKVSQKGQRTIFDDLGAKYNNFNSVGRLDKDSEGLLLLTNDGDLLNELTHPKHLSEKKYIVLLNKPLDETDVKKLESGIIIDDYKTKPIVIENYSYEDYKFLFSHKPENAYIFTLKEGRNRQIRKMMESVNRRVVRLIRVEHADYKLDQGIYLKYTTKTIK